MQTASKRTITGWAFYDWANSVYILVITTTFFPVFYTEMTSQPPFNGEVKLLGRTYVNTALYNYALATAYIFIAILMPILTSMADYKQNKKRYMQFFCYLGALSCSLMYFFTPKNFDFGIICMMVAAFAFYGSVVFYNSYLPDIAAEKDRDRISAKGFTYGYIGSVIMQLIGFAIVVFWDRIPFLSGEGQAVRFTFFLVGIWWAGFAQITFRRLPKHSHLNNNLQDALLKSRKDIITGGFIELNKIFRNLRKMPVIRRYLFAFFFYNMGVQTVILTATNFGSKLLHLPATNLIIVIVLIQLVAIAGAYLIAMLSEKIGNLQTLIWVVLMWIGICVGGYYIQTPIHFYIMAMGVGLVMGGIQSLSRSTYAKLIPSTQDTASYFSFYDVSEKVAIVIGLVVFGLIDERLGIRQSVLSLITFFAIGFIGLLMALKKQNQLRKLIIAN